jgi:NAD-dependent SIR2 family protein deacetylase
MTIETEYHLRCAKCGGDLEAAYLSRFHRINVEPCPTCIAPSIVTEEYEDEVMTDAEVTARDAPDLLAACETAKKYLEGDLFEPGRTVFWKLVAAIKEAKGNEKP